MKMNLLTTGLILIIFIMVTSTSAAQNTPDKSGKKIISTEKAPAAIGPYSQGIVAGGLLFTSGQLPIHPVTGIVPSTIEEQTKQVLDNLKSVVEAAGLTLGNIVKTTVYLQSMGDFETMNKIYATYFPNNPPARATVEVSKMAKNALVEIDAVAVFK
jgi:2-iminobutanoate/2-iminopropanoate deaminase